MPSPASVPLDDDALIAALDPACVPALLQIPPLDVASDPRELRRRAHVAADAMPWPPPPPTVSVEEVPRRGDVPPLRIYRPARRGLPQSGLLWVHGGGLIAGSARYDDVACTSIAEEHGCPVVSVDYRLAPEWPYPHALEDCFAALRWVLDDEAGLSIAPGRLVVEGTSAGAGLSVALALLARDRGVDAIAALLCAYPMLDDRPHPSMLRTTARRTWHCAANEIAWRAYLGHLDEVPVYAAPGRAAVDDLVGLPPVFLDVGTLDAFLDEDLALVGRLARAGVAVELVVTPGACHASEELNRDAPTSRRILAARRAARARALAEPPSTSR